MTQLRYMEEQFNLKDSAKVVQILESDGKTIVTLDSTIFYPQGGGSPFDQGEITNDDSSFRVDEVRFVDGEVYHIGEFTSGRFQTGDEVMLIVDPQRRDMITKLQSAGHLIDMAMRDIGREDLIPDKGFHFPEGPSVEYKGVIPEEEREQIVSDLQNSLDKMIDEGYEVIVKMSNKQEAEELCYFVPPNLPENKPIRIVSVWNNEFMPCGAIHVGNISELKGLKVTKIKSKKGNTKIKYEV